MSRVDLHPEELFDRARRGQVSDLESERLEAHLEGCRACRFEQALSLDCAEGAAALPGDELVIARVRRATLRALEARASSRRGVLGGRWSRSPVLWVAVAAVVLLGALTAGATLAGRSRRTTASREAPQPRVTFLPLPTPRTTGPAQGTAGGAAPTVEDDPTPKLAEASAAELFARANRARRNGDANDAARIYRDLQASFPGSAEELASRVTFGRLLLDRLGDAHEALAQFDSYLANPTHGGLREEALIGRALSLGQLGRRSEEKSAWSALLASYPASAYVKRARTRLEELR